nr:hypothetical protein [Tanacetum cinerariifolium]
MLKKHLKELAWKNGDIFEKVKVLREELKIVLDKNPNDKRLREEESGVLHEYNVATSDEEKLLFQKAKIKWLFMGDRNNAYFHMILKIGNHINRVNAVHDEEGRIFEDIKWGTNLLNISNSFWEEAMSMIKIVSDAEIKKEMFQINDNKSPGQDGKPMILSIGLFLEKMLKGFGFHDRMGGRGLKQGDPMSHYLFTLVMEILNNLMIRRIEITNGKFNHGDRASVEMIKETIEEFGSVSGLLPNYNKSTILFVSVKEDDRQSILSVIPFRVEKLPVRYLGVPLISKRIVVKDCKSFGGQVLESIHVYWETVFLLPQAVIKEINSLLKGFLWNQDERANGRAKTMALNHDSLSPTNQRQANVTQADRTVRTSNELDLLFSPMYDELLNGSSKVVSKSFTVSAVDAWKRIRSKRDKFE